MWVVEEGENLVEGDYLISSATPGHAMKDNGQFDLANIISRVAEPVDWSTVTEVINGKKHKRISVLFESFVRNHKADKLENEMKLMKEDVERMKLEMLQIKNLLNTEAKNKGN